MELITYLRTKQKEIDGLRSLMTECPEDKDMLDMANEELSQAMEEEKRLQNLLLKSLLPRDDADERDCILEDLEGKRLLYLRWIYSKCMRDSLRITVGNLKWYI